MNRKWTLALCGALAFALLAGCGSKANDASGQPGNQAQNQAQDGSGGDAQGGPNGQGRFGGMGMVDENGNAASLMGKVKSIDGQTVTVYKSSFDPSKMPAGGGRNGGGGAPPSGAPDGEPNGSAAPGGGADNGGGVGQNAGGQNGGGQAGNNNGSRRQGGMGNMFTDETEAISVTDATKIEQTSFENGQATTKSLTLADLKADDVLTIWLKEGTQEATLIRVGGFGGGFGGGGGGGGQWQGRQGQGQGQGQNQQQGQDQQTQSQSTDQTAGG